MKRFLKILAIVIVVLIVIRRPGPTSKSRKSFALAAFGWHNRRQHLHRRRSCLQPVSLRAGKILEGRRGVDAADLLQGAARDGSDS